LRQGQEEESMEGRRGRKGEWKKGAGGGEGKAESVVRAEKESDQEKRKNAPLPRTSTS
jgi:hypothetical protein